MLRFIGIDEIGRAFASALLIAIAWARASAVLDAARRALNLLTISSAGFVIAHYTSS
jgi:hypothetical protein